MDALRPLIDDLTILDTEVVFRIIPPRVVKSWDPPIISTNAFGDQTLEVAQSYGLEDRCVSVALESVWSEREGTIEQLLAKQDPNSGIARITVGDLRQLHTGNGTTARPQGIMRAPLDDAPWHAVVFDATSIPRSDGAKKAMQAKAEWFHLPTQPAESVAGPEDHN